MTVLSNMLSDDEERQSARALDILTIVARGLQETNCPALALGVAAADLYGLAMFSLLVLAYRESGQAGIDAAVMAIRTMLGELQGRIAQHVREIPLHAEDLGAATFTPSGRPH